MPIPKNGVWITWENQRRNIGICSELGWSLHVITHNDQRMVRYIKSLNETLAIIIKNKPDFVAAQNPSIILSLTVVLLKFIFGYISIIDAHNAGLFPLDNRNFFLNFISKKIQELADLTIVTNDNLAKIVNKNNGRSLVLPDKIPDPPQTIHPFELTGSINLAYICSFSSDEPYQEVIEAAKLISSDIHIHITGNHKGKVKDSIVHSNIKLVGFLPEENYWRLISSVDGIIVLTKRENCLVCGAYEGVSLRKPMILSRTKAIMNYFTSGCVYTAPNAMDIKTAILYLIENRKKLQADIIDLEVQLRRGWKSNFANLLDSIR
jgi:hypothetical protein